MDRLARNPKYISDLKELARNRGGIVEAIVQPHYLETAEDRPAAILLASQLEDALQDLLESIMVDLTGTERGELFGGDRLLGSFGNKIHLAYALRLIGPLARKDLDLIRHIRNTFAHSRQSISFSTAQIASACNHLTITDRCENLTYWKGIEQPLDTARRRFIAAVDLYRIAMMSSAHPVLREIGRASEPEIPLN